MKWVQEEGDSCGYLEVSASPERHELWAKSDIVAEAPNASVLIDYDERGNILGIEVVA